MKNEKTGSALLLVIVITTGLAIYATTIYWVFHYMRLSALHMIKAQKVSSLTDGLAEYAKGLYVSEQVSLSTGEYAIHFSSWPPDNSECFSGSIEIKGTLEKAMIRSSLFYDERVVQTISYMIENDKSSGRYIINDWQRIP